MSTAIGPRAYCHGCFHGWRLEIDTYRYDQTAMCSLGTDQARLDGQVQFFAPFLPPSGRVLEIGCATGELARSTRARLPVSRYEAIELSPAGEQARSHVDRLHDAPLPNLLAAGAIEGPFDLVLMSHVLEHLEAPWDELDAILKVVAPEGSLFLEVPNASGNRGLPIDDNSSHLHFFTVRSLSHLLAAKGLDTVATLTDARLDARYADSLRVIARRFKPPQWSPTLLSDEDLVQEEGPIIVWGAGSLADEVLANFFDPARIAFFIDRDPAKQGGMRLGRPVKGPDDLPTAPSTILINSIDFAPSIEADIRRLRPGAAHRLVPIGDLIERTGRANPAREGRP
ncbi:MAG TPA: methyltransferase domain-containing protein [Caulobacteraceae bacterium]|jgi:2-polyprenyl-3-methyl-5-hydroxy-6-metoxy-1,4-benzoquinol methylase